MSEDFVLSLKKNQELPSLFYFVLYIFTSFLHYISFVIYFLLNMCISYKFNLCTSIYLESGYKIVHKTYR